MNTSQRVVLVLSCLLFVYCCTWIPWHVPARHFADGVIRPATDAGYKWLWIVPQPYAVPDLVRIGLRLCAATAVSFALFIVAALGKNSGRK